RQRNDVLRRPPLQREGPGQSEQTRIDRAGWDAQCVLHDAPEKRRGAGDPKVSPRRVNETYEAETTGLSFKRSPVSVSNACTCPAVAARVTVSPAFGWLRPSTRATRSARLPLISACPYR